MEEDSWVLVMILTCYQEGKEVPETAKEILSEDSECILPKEKL